MDLVRGSFEVVDSAVAMEKVVSNGCSSCPQEDDVTESITLESFNSDSVTDQCRGEMSVVSSGTNTDLACRAQIPEDGDSVLKYDTDCKKSYTNLSLIHI